MTDRSLDELLGALRSGPPELIGDRETRVGTVTLDSRSVMPGALFCCVRGDRTDGHLHASEAVASGATALLVDHRLPIDVAQLVVTDVRAAIGPAAAAFHGHPSDDLIVVGVTGTNGKTTTSQLIAAVLEGAGLPTDVHGTLSGRFTTPEAPEVQRRLAHARDNGRRAVVMEVSSHALALHRVDGTRFTISVFTNLGRDHYDFHGTEERYFAAKARLFEPALSERGVVNLDDVHGQLLSDTGSIPLVGFTTTAIEDVLVEATRHSYRWRDVAVTVPIGGRFNVENSLAAATTAAELGIDPSVIAASLAGAAPVPGRFEAVHAGQDFAVVVDYAHTPDGLRRALEAARDTAAGHRVIVVFGCGGDRDQEKRPQMGSVAASLADVVVVTSDNPRSEDPGSIVASVLGGVPPEYRHRAMSEPDRRRAIELALGQAGPGDVVVVAGKGHETTQTIGTTALPFDDRAVVRELLERQS